MIQQRTIGSLTEIYVGGGNFIIQSYPTNFHQFATRKILTPNDNVDNYREVTEAEKTVLEKSDAAWIEPSAELIDRIKVAGADYNVNTGFFELNGLTDLTARDIEAILQFGVITPDKFGAGSRNATFGLMSIRTNILWENGSDILRSNCTFDHLCYGQLSLETFRVGTNEPGTYICSPVRLSDAFKGCSKLREIIGVINLDKFDTSGVLPFDNCIKLTTVHFHRLTKPFDLRNVPALSLESITELIANAENTTPITITLHPEAYARVTDEIFAAAAEKNITIATI